MIKYKLVLVMFWRQWYQHIKLAEHIWPHRAVKSVTVSDYIKGTKMTKQGKYGSQHEKQDNDIFVCCLIYKGQEVGRNGYQFK